VILPVHRPLIALIVLLVAVFVAQQLVEDELGAHMMVPTRVQSAGEAIAHGQGDKGDWLSLTTLLTAALLHANVGHIASNLLFFWIFGALISEILGWRWTLTLFILTAIGGSIGDLILRNGSPIPSLGASGTVLGFEGAYLGLAVRWSLPNPSIWPIAYPIPPFNLALVACVGFFLDIQGVLSSSGEIAYGAHLGGFLVGLVLTCLIIPAPKSLSH